jgi:3-oxoacyl-[acyl-carrier-protein] synthase III
MFNSQLEIVSTGVSKGSKIVTNEELADQEWYKYDTQGQPLGEPRKTSAEDIFGRFWVKSRPIVAEGEDHLVLFNNALDEAIARAEAQGLTDIRGNIVALFAGSTTEQARIPNFLDEVCKYAGLHQNQYKEFVQRACSTFNNGVTKASAYVEENPGIEGYIVIGASEVLSGEWAPKNFDRNLFGDLASVVIARVTPARDLDPSMRGIVGCLNIHTPDTENRIVRGPDGLLYMDGMSVQQFAPLAMVQDCLRSAETAGLSLRDIDEFIFHSGSKHIWTSIRREMKKERAYGEDLTNEQLPHCLGDYGNNGGATTPNVIHRQFVEGKISPGDTVYVGSLGKGIYRSAFIFRAPYLSRRA